MSDDCMCGLQTEWDCLLFWPSMHWCVLIRLWERSVFWIIVFPSLPLSTARASSSARRYYCLILLLSFPVPTTALNCNNTVRERVRGRADERLHACVTAQYVPSSQRNAINGVQAAVMKKISDVRARFVFLSSSNRRIKCFFHTNLPDSFTSVWFPNTFSPPHAFFTTLTFLSLFFENNLVQIRKPSHNHQPYFTPALCSTVIELWVAITPLRFYNKAV